jgi:hypothetical protein
LTAIRLANLSLLTQLGAHMALIMQGGRLIKNTLRWSASPTSRASRDQAS